ncbi:hypothetical protein [Palleronia caenipelagi]|uniref:Bacteriophage CI repressor n=1 Tax=Palleronia caenipelagi TaxID=2489174 RepID=A0A547Q831_9RHOB|nr:hypothetical protein [Palleronia caenipelagi]TRD22538.1 hypothetical protein FEV53_03745 [Palleronia caenipelagi]
MDDVEETITALKALYSVQTDTDLAAALQLGKSAIGAWRRRGRVPNRYQPAHHEDLLKYREIPKARLSYLEELAKCLALMRMIRDFQNVTKDQRVFFTVGRFLNSAFDARYESALKQLSDIDVRVDDTIPEHISLQDSAFKYEEMYQDIEGAFQVLVHDEFFSKDGLRDTVR